PPLEKHSPSGVKKKGSVLVSGLVSWTVPFSSPGAATSKIGMYPVAEVELVTVIRVLNWCGTEPFASSCQPAVPVPALPKPFPVNTTVSPGQPLFGDTDSSVAARAAGAC